MRIFAAPAPGVSVASPQGSRVIAFPVRPQHKLRGVSAPQPEPKGMSAMAARAELKDTVPESERALAQEIAKAMQPPLMSRLARVQSSFAVLPEPGHVSPAPGAEMPPPIPAPQLATTPQPVVPAASPLPLSPAMMDLIADDPDAGFSTPPSAEWLGKARRERNRARLSNAFAWLATLAIGGGIVTATMLILPR
jgi:hypothetical protein